MANFSSFGVISSLLLAILTVYWGFFIYMKSSLKDEGLPNIVRFSIQKRLYLTLKLFFVFYIADLILAFCYFLMTPCKNGLFTTISIIYISLFTLSLFVIPIVQLMILLQKDWLQSYFNNKMKQLGDKVVARHIFEKTYRSMTNTMSSIIHNTTTVSSIDSAVSMSQSLFMEGRIESSDVALVEDAYRTIVFLKKYQHCCKVDADLQNSINELINRLQ